MMKAHKGMKPQDVAVLLFIAQYVDGNYKVLDIANALEISQSEISESINRSKIAKLIDPADKKVFRYGLLEFLIHGLKYVFPIQPGPIVKGVPTAHSGPPLNKMIVAGNEQFVWKASGGTLRGMSVEPLYRTLPKISANYLEFYELLCLLDTLRIGRAREVNIAQDILKKRLIINE
ncbi:MAG TPA: hypothetical protein VKY57_11310 [Chitinispirillaceae bacterium]|nr:hypothetical protein [Chitinispirillaceae bacterium]